jgi:hypothetical protein
MPAFGDLVKRPLCFQPPRSFAVKLSLVQLSPSRLTPLRKAAVTRKSFMSKTALYVLGVLFSVLLWGRAATAQNYNYTIISAPNSESTQVRRINNAGFMAGQFTDTTGRTHGFMDVAGVFTTIDGPGALLTQANGLNSSGSVVGTYIDLSGFSHGFVDNGGVVTTLDVPGSLATQAYDINDSGQIVGSYSDSLGQHGFLYAGTYITIDYGGFGSTIATGINNGGDIVGYFASTAGMTVSLLDVGGRITTIRSSMAITEAHGINDSSVIVGVDGAQTQFSSFIVQNGRFTRTRLNVPGSILTEAEDINDSGQIVGWWINGQSPAQGFLASPGRSAGQ